MPAADLASAKSPKLPAEGSVGCVMHMCGGRVWCTWRWRNPFATSVAFFLAGLLASSDIRRLAVSQAKGLADFPVLHSGITPEASHT